MWTASSATEKTCVACWNGENRSSGSADIDAAPKREQWLAVLDGAPILNEQLLDDAAVHDVDTGRHAQRFHATDRLARLDALAARYRWSENADARRGDRQYRRLRWRRDVGLGGG